MSAEPRQFRTDAEQVLAEQYRSVRSRLPGSPAVARRRDEAFANFERLGLPHRRIEAWKYTDLRALMRWAAPPAEPATAEKAAQALAAAAAFPGLDRYRLVLIDGYFQEGLSDRVALRGEGVEVATLAEFLAFDHPRVLDILDSPAGAGDDAMIALNAAMATDGLAIVVKDGAALSKPVEIVQLSTGERPSAWFARNAVQVGRGAAVRLLISRAGPSGVSYQASSVTGIAAAEGAAVKIVDLQAEGDSAQHIAAFSARLAANATLDHLSVAIGGGLSRLQGFVTMEGEGARLSASGVNLLSGTARGDVALVIDHIAPGAASRVLYRNVARDSAVGAFEGRIVVRPGAPKTDGRMLINTLLLSDTAEFAAKPELEIYADDVQCGHGATTGRLDEATLFYLRSRGVPRAEAEALLLKAFVSEPVAAIGDAAIALSVEARLASILEGGGS